jgi:hypothetical protein
LKLTESSPTNQQTNEDYSDAMLNYRNRPKQILFPFSTNNQYVTDYFDRETSNVIPQFKKHRIQTRDGTTKFRWNDGGLRNARGFGKRSLRADPSVEK